MPNEESSSNPWTKLSHEVKYESSYFIAREDIVSFRGRPPRPYSNVRMKVHGVTVVPIDESGCLTLVGQYRYVLDRFTWELPGGGVPTGADELTIAKAELSEEVGQHAGQWLKIVAGAASVGTTDQLLSGYVAWDIAQATSHPEPEEELTLRRVSFREAVDMALRGEIAHMSGNALLLGIEVRLRRGDLPAGLIELLRRNA